MSNKNPSTQFRYVLYEWIVNQAGSGQYGWFLKAVRRAVLFLIRLCFSTLFFDFYTSFILLKVDGLRNISHFTNFFNIPINFLFVAF